MFSEGRTNVHDDDRSGRPSLVTADLLDQVNEKIRENRGFTTSEEFLAAERFISDDEANSRAALRQNVGGRLLRRGDRNLGPDMTNVSIWVAIMSRSS
jgi:transposase